MLEIQSVAIELADPRGGNHNAVRILERQNVQCSVYGIAKGLQESNKLVIECKEEQEESKRGTHTVVSRLSGAEFHMIM